MAGEQTSDRSDTYWIVVRGVISADWSEWFGDLTIVPQATGRTLLCGPVADQAALHGILRKIDALGLPLISVQSGITEDSQEQEASEGETSHE